jgi:uncharacterized membrane protein
MKPVSLAVTIFLALVAVGQLLRFVFKVEVTAGGLTVPLWLSLVASVFAGALAIMLWLENRKK